MLLDIQFLKWDSYKNANNEDLWKDEDLSKEEFEKLSWLVVQQIKKDRMKFSGDDHQNQEGCAPRFRIRDKEYIYTATMRTWGDLMAQAWNDLEQSMKYNYMDFYVNGF